MTAILSAAACSHFPLYPGREELHVAPNSVLLVFSLSCSSLFPAKDHWVRPSSSSPLPRLCLGSSSDCPKPAGKDKAPYDSLTGWQGGGGGWRELCCPGNLCLGRLQTGPQCVSACSEGPAALLPGESPLMGSEHWGLCPQLLPCSRGTRRAQSACTG